MSLTGCIKKAGDYLHPEDKLALLARARELRSTGMNTLDAGRQAVTEHIGTLADRLDAHQSKGLVNASEPADRERLAWRGKEMLPSGPHYRGDGFALVAPERISQSDFIDSGHGLESLDFNDPKTFADKSIDRGAQRSMASAGLLGHAERVVPGTETYQWQVLGPTGRRAGTLVGDVDANGTIRSVHDINLTDKRQGLGRNIVAHLAANSPEPLKIQDITHDAEPFWNKLGAGSLTADRDANLGWDAAALGQRGAHGPDAARDGAPREVAGDSDQASQRGVLGVPETHELTADQARDLGFDPDHALVNASEPEHGSPADEQAAEREPIEKIEAAAPHVDAAPAKGMDDPVVTGDGTPVARKPLSTPGAKIVDVFKKLRDDLLFKVSPMSMGNHYARDTAKNYANADRLARWQWAKFDNILKTNYTEAERQRMYDAGEEENLIRGGHLKADPSKGLASLDAGQRDTMEVLHKYGNELLDRASAAGMFEGTGVPFWTPRMAVMIGEDGSYMRPKGDDRSGGFTTTSNNLKQRKYLTADETEAAMKAHGMELVRDIRTMPLAMARLERAIAGRELVNSIKEFGARTGTELVRDQAGEGWFTIDHPAFKTYTARTENGKTIYKSEPLYMAAPFKGPLHAVIGEKNGAIYQALMAAKAKTMGVIMYSPLIHNGVEWGRALPMLPGKVLTLRVYFEGNRVKNDPVQMRQAIKDGLVPIGKNGGMQDITGLMEEPNVKPGRSLTAKAAGGAVGLVNKGAGEAVKRGIDKAGDVWHGTLLWDRVADLQAGLYSNLRASNITKGMDPVTAGRLAAHWANRFAGALPNEAMSAMARKAANLGMFSRSFTLGNLGAMKDVLTGMPKDIQSQIMQNSGEAVLKTAKNMARRKAAGAMLIDIGLMYGANQLAQAAFSTIVDNNSWGDIGQGYAERLHALMGRMHENPWEVMNAPLASFESLMQTSENEPGKSDRVHVGRQADGRELYARLPTGKVGEDMKNWMTSPIETAKKKMGTLAKPLMQVWNNDNGLGKKIYNPDEPGVTGVLKNLGRIVGNVMGAQIPLDAMKGVGEMVKGTATAADKLKAIGPLAGITFSQGAPGGAAMGEEFDAKRQADNKTQFIMPDVLKALKDGDVDKAREIMQDIPGITPKRMDNIIRRYMNPESRDTVGADRQFHRIATPEQKERMERVRER